MKSCRSLGLSPRNVRRNRHINAHYLWIIICLMWKEWWVYRPVSPRIRAVQNVGLSSGEKFQNRTSCTTNPFLVKDHGNIAKEIADFSVFCPSRVSLSETGEIGLVGIKRPCLGHGIPQLD